jgi:hypothetical protein
MTSYDEYGRTISQTTNVDGNIFANFIRREQAFQF